MNPMELIMALQIVGTIAFAISGAMVAIRKEMDLFGICVLGVVTAVGGGMLRDLNLTRTPEALINPLYAAVAVATSIVTFLVVLFFHGRTSVLLKSTYDRILLLMDSVGLGIFTAVGVNTGIEAGQMNNVFLLVFLGTLTGVGGGLMRDMMAGVPPYIFVRHIYACASVIGAAACVYLYRVFGQLPALLVSSLIVMMIRLLAAHFRWNLPRIRRIHHPHPRHEI